LSKAPSLRIIIVIMCALQGYEGGNMPGKVREGERARQG